MNTSTTSTEPLSTAEPRENSSRQQITVIAPRRGWQLINVGELWRYRELLFFLMWRDYKVRYKQTALGVAWAVVQPLVMMAILAVVMRVMARVPMGEHPPTIFLFAGLLPWIFFSTSITTAGNSVVNAQAMVSKVYFPRLAIPLASIGAAGVNFFIQFILLGLMMVYYGIAPGWGIAMLPVLLLLTMLAALGIGTALAALNVSYRDFRHTLPFLVQVWMFATPSIYMDIFDEKVTQPTPAVAAAASADEQEQDTDGVLFHGIADCLYLNPMTGVIASFRAAVLNEQIPWRMLGYSASVIVVTFFLGCFYFRRVEGTFADVI